MAIVSVEKRLWLRDVKEWYFAAKTDAQRVGGQYGDKDKERLMTELLLAWRQLTILQTKHRVLKDRVKELYRSVKDETTREKETGREIT